MGKGGNVGRHELTEAIQEEMRNRLTEGREAIPDDIESEATLITGDPVEALVNVAEAPGTLLVVGSRGYGPLRRVLLGSVSTELVRSAPCPLIVTPRGMHDTAETAPAAEVGSRVMTQSNGPVLLAYDGSESSATAIAVAGRLLPGREALVCHAWTGVSQTGLLGALAEMPARRRRRSQRNRPGGSRGSREDRGRGRAAR